MNTSDTNLQRNHDHTNTSIKSTMSISPAIPAASPAISIIIPMYNSRATVAQTLDSLLAQTEASWEAIIIDDGSTDGCGEIVGGHIARDPRFRLVRRENGGPAAARNTGLDLARGRYIAFLDPDDTVYPHAYETLLRTAEGSPHGLALGRWDHCDGEGRPLGWTESPGSGSGASEVGLDHLLSLECFAIHAQLMSRDTLGGLRFDTTMAYNEDTDLFIRIAVRGPAWKTCDATVCTYRLKAINRGTRTFVARFRYDTRIIREGFARARSAGWAERGVDVGEVREQRLLHHHALRYAHLTLLQDPSATAQLAADVFGPARLDIPVDPRSAALAIRDFQFVDCLTAAALEADVGRYAAALAPWWRRCIAEGWAEPTLETEARRALARELASMQDLAPDLLNRCGASRTTNNSTSARRTLARPLVVLGLGRNGQRLARELHQRGLPVVVRDDALDARAAAARLPDIPLTFIAADADYDTHPLYLMSVLDDEAYLDRLPRELDIVRWSDLNRDRVETIHARLIRAWPAEELPITEFKTARCAA